MFRHILIDTRFQRGFLDAGSNPMCGTEGSVSENHIPDQPMSYEGSWVVSRYLAQHWGFRYQNIGIAFSKQRNIRKEKTANIRISEAKMVNIIEFVKYRISEYVW